MRVGLTTLWQPPHPSHAPLPACPRLQLGLDRRLRVLPFSLRNWASPEAVRVSQPHQSVTFTVDGASMTHGRQSGGRQAQPSTAGG